MVGREWGGLTGQWRNETEPEGGRPVCPGVGAGHGPQPFLPEVFDPGNPAPVSGLSGLWDLPNSPFPELMVWSGVPSLPRALQPVHPWGTVLFPRATSTPRS